MKKYFAKEDGQGLVEYGLIISLVAIISVSSLSAFSGGLVDKFSGFGSALETEQDAPLSPLGDNFSEISTNIIDRIIQNFIDNGKYGMTWSDRTFTDIGLDPEDWKNPVGHIIYKPSGATLRIRPEDGWSFSVVNNSSDLKLNGTQMDLPASYNWDLLYNDYDKQWYYKKVSPENMIDIDTLVVKKNN